MKPNKIEEHYKFIAKGLNEYYSSKGEYNQWITSLIIESLSVKNTDFLVDLGCGTGIYSQLIFDSVGLNNKILCVDPNENMLIQAKTLHGVKLIQLDAKEMGQIKSIKYDKMLIKEVVHHLGERITLWKNFKHQLSQEGMILIVTRPKNPRFPFFKAAHKKFSIGQPSSELLIQELNEAGLKTKISTFSFVINMKKEKWYNLLVKRFMSHLSEFTDEEIIKGILELEKEFWNKDFLEIIDEHLFIIAKK